MKKTKKILLIIAMLLLLLPIKIFAAGGVSVNSSSITLENGGGTSFKITATNAAGKVTITSNNTGVVTVDKTSEWVENQTITVNVKAIAPGNTTITVNVNAATFDEEPIVNTYTINVTVKPPKSSNNNLSNLSVDGKSVSGFSSSKTSYDLGTTTNGSINITATAEDGKATISGTGSKNINYGKNAFNVVVTAENGSKKTYTITITKPDNRNTDNTLSSLSVSPLDLKFNKNTTNYSFNVEHSVSSITINAKANNSKATVSGTGTKTLKDYVNTFNIVVTAENGSKKTYTIKVIRKDAEGNLGFVSKDNSLKGLSVEGYKIDFNKDKLEYSIEVDNLVDSIKVTAQVNHSGATYEVVGNTDLKVGTNTVKVNVTSESGDIKTYTINVTRKSDAPTTTVKDLESILEKTTAKEVIIEIKDDNTVLDNKTLTIMKNSKKQFVINNYVNDVIRYTWTINGNNINDVAAIETFIKFTSDRHEEIGKLTNYADVVYLNFKHDGKLPKDTKVKVYVGDKYQDGSIVGVYFYNETKNKMDAISKAIKVTDGCVEFEIEHCSDYIITQSILNQKSSNDIPLYIAIVEFIVISGYIIYKVLISKKQGNKK